MMNIVIISEYFLKRIAPAIIVTSMCCFIFSAQAQEKKAATIGLSFYKKADMSKTAVALVKGKNKENKFAPARNVKVNFYFEQNKAQHFIESSVSDNSGKAVITLPKELPLDTGRFFTIVAKVENNNLYEDAEEQVNYKEANLTLKLDAKDTSRTVTAIVTEIGKDGKKIPVKDAEVKFYVQRLFGFMPASEDYTVTTDEKGEASFAYPKNIPGDTAGIITMAARMEDNERYGNVENNTSVSWGTVLVKEKNPFPRALWEPYAPIPLVITVSTLFGGVWCVYFFIFFQLHKIKKAGHV